MNITLTGTEKQKIEMKLLVERGKDIIERQKYEANIHH